MIAVTFIILSVLNTIFKKIKDRRKMMQNLRANKKIKQD